MEIPNISDRYYSLFIATNFAAAVIYFFFLPETGGKSLEEIAEVFGDALATEHIGDIDVGKRNETDDARFHQSEFTDKTANVNKKEAV